MEDFARSLQIQVDHPNLAEVLYLVVTRVPITISQLFAPGTEADRRPEIFYVLEVGVEAHEYSSTIDQHPYSPLLEIKIGDIGHENRGVVPTSSISCSHSKAPYAWLKIKDWRCGERGPAPPVI